VGENLRMGRIFSGLRHATGHAVRQGQREFELHVAYAHDLDKRVVKASFSCISHVVVWDFCPGLSMRASELDWAAEQEATK